MGARLNGRWGWRWGRRKDIENKNGVIAPVRSLFGWMGGWDELPVLTSCVGMWLLGPVLTRLLVDTVAPRIPPVSTTNTSVPGLPV
jgi:hypothetical protein